jgi:hypothetical protein
MSHAMGCVNTCHEYRSDSRLEFRIHNSVTFCCNAFTFCCLYSPHPRPPKFFFWCQLSTSRNGWWGCLRENEQGGCETWGASPLVERCIVDTSRISHLLPSCVTSSLSTAACYSDNQEHPLLTHTALPTPLFSLMSQRSGFSNFGFYSLIHISLSNSASNISLIYMSVFHDILKYVYSFKFFSGVRGQYLYSAPY